MPATRRAIITGLAATPLVLGAREAWGMPDSFAPVVRMAAPSIVGISVTDYAGPKPARPRLPRALIPPEQRVPEPGLRAPGLRKQEDSEDGIKAIGSGFIIDPAGLIVTNNHVVGNATRIIVTLDDGGRFPASIAGADQLTDLAVIRIEAGRPLPPARWGDSARVQVGDWVLAAGNPFDLGTSFTAGIVSARGREIGDGPFDHFLQLDAPINPGNSGGPAFNMRGRVVGVNTAIVSPSGGSVGIGFAIPSDMARRVVAALIAHGAIPRGWLGVAVGDAPEGMAGVAILGIEPGGPAARAALRPGDIVEAVNNLPVNDAGAMIRAIASVPPGTTERLTIKRNREVFTLPVTVGRRPAELGSD